MTILLVKKVSNNVPQTPGRWLAGEIVAAFDDGHEFGTEEVVSAGNFFHINITNRTTEQVQQYLQHWEHEPTSNIDNTDGNGGFRITITSTMVSASGKNAITRAQMDNFVERWGGVYVSHTNTTYTFDITTYAAATSEGLFGPQVSQVTFVDEGFSSGSQQVGVTDIGPFEPDQIRGAVADVGGVVVDANSFSIKASVLYDAFIQDIEDSWRNIAFKRRRWSINSAGMTALDNAGGSVSVTAAQVLAYLEDGLTT